MKIKTFFGQKEKIYTEGATVVVDILRAATVEAFLLSKGASCIFPVETVAEAFKLKKDHPEYLLVGEENGYPIKGFDFENSPSQINKNDFTGKTVVHRTSNGTRQLLLTDSDVLLLGSLNIISATYDYIIKQNVSIVNFMGAEDDDKIFFKAFESIANGKKLEKEKVKQELLTWAKDSWFFDDTMPEFPKEDVFLAADVDRFHFACVVKKEQGRLVTRKSTS